jgi:hypothetical protein
LEDKAGNITVRMKVGWMEEKTWGLNLGAVDHLAGVPLVHIWSREGKVHSLQFIRLENKLGIIYPEIWRIFLVNSPEQNICNALFVVYFPIPFF